MPTVDVAATRAAAEQLDERSGALHETRTRADAQAAAQSLSDSSTRWVLDDLQTAVQLGLVNLAGEVAAMSSGMSTLADNVERATGG